MNLKLTINGSINPLINYLKNFCKIRPSLLIEIDTSSRLFVAKTFTEDRGAIRFSALSFDNANVSIVSDDGEGIVGDNRIKMGIVQQLPKLIKIIEQFNIAPVKAEDESTNTNVVDINIQYKESTESSNKSEYIVEEITFKSPELEIKQVCFRITEFKYLSDDIFFNTVYNVNNPVSVELSSDIISNIIKISDITKVDLKNSQLFFYNDNTKLYVTDTDAENKRTFTYFIGELNEDPIHSFNVLVSREKFIQMMDKADESYNIIFGWRDRGGESEIDRILFDSVKTQTKVVISILVQN